MDRRIKKGDKVVCINNKFHGLLDGYLTIGKTYTVLEDEFDMDCLSRLRIKSDKQTEKNFFKRRFKLYDDKPESQNYEEWIEE